MGVFATRSPFRPNNIGLSCVRLEKIDGTELIVSGADLMDGTELVDIKPYVPYADCHPDATGGFAKDGQERLKVVAPEELLSAFPRVSVPHLSRCWNLTQDLNIKTIPKDYTALSLQDTK